jgi:GAF domain-containing protein
VTVLIFPIGCAYAILRHRIFDVNFVLNRTLVFTILTSFVVGLFILLEKVLEGAAAGRGVGIAVETIVALVIGFSFNAMHKRLEEWIARVLFRAKFEAAKALRRLADEAPYMEREQALLLRAVGDVRQSTGASAVAIYEREDEMYRVSAREGAPAPPDEIEIDDLAFVRMRKAHGAVDLGDVPSMLGADGLLFPFSTRGTLTGAMLCRRRPNGEAYAPDEIALLAHVAHEVGTEIVAIRARRQAEILDAIISGNVDVRDVRAQLETT